MRYRLICFDAGFTLLEPRRSMAKTLATILAPRDIVPTAEALGRAREIADSWFREEYHRPNNDSWISDERIQRTWRNYHCLILRELGIDDREYAIVDRVISTYFKPENWQSYPDVLSTLDALQRLGLTMGIVSDWGSELISLVEALGISSYFDFVLASATAGAAKPSARFYQMALRAADVAPNEALMIGDSYAADVIGARAAGMGAVLLDRLGTSDASDVPIIYSLTELVRLLN